MAIRNETIDIIGRHLWWWYMTPIILCVLCSMAWAANGEQSSDTESNIVTYGLEADVVSAYLWHGMAITRTPVGHPWLWASAYGFTLSAWGTKDFSGVDRNDAELILEYEKSWGAFTISPFLEWYFYPAADAAGELTVKAEYSFSGTLGIFTEQSVFLWGNPGDYAGRIGFVFKREFSDAFSIAVETGLLWASASFNRDNFETEKWTLDGWTTEITAKWYPWKHLYVSPHAGMSIVLDRELTPSTATLPIAGLSVGLEY
jgi:hypothetical protein